MIEPMAEVRMNEADVIRDIVAVLAKVRQGIEVVVEQDHRTVAIITPPQRSGRPASEILREAEQRNSTVTLDEDFGNDMEAIIASHQQPGKPPSWD